MYFVFMVDYLCFMWHFHLRFVSILNDNYCNTHNINMKIPLCIIEHFPCIHKEKICFCRVKGFYSVRKLSGKRDIHWRPLHPSSMWFELWLQYFHPFSIEVSVLKKSPNFVSVQSSNYHSSDHLSRTLLAFQTF